MFSRCLPLGLLLAVLIGCSKKKADDTGDAPGTDPELTGPEYTLKLRAEQQGDKSHVTVTVTGSSTTTVSGPKGKQSETKKGVDKYEFTETIHEFPAGAAKPTKVTRAFKVAQETEAGKPTKHFTYAGKTVLIEKKNGRYAVTADGKPLPPAEDAKLRKSFEKPVKLKNEDTLPKKPVRVNEKWALDPAVLANIAEDLELPINKDTSMGTGKLSKVYSKEGKQWGVIDLNIDFKIAADAGPKVDGTFTFLCTLDTPVDGSPHEGAMRVQAQRQDYCKRCW